MSRQVTVTPPRVVPPTGGHPGRDNRLKPRVALYSHDTMGLGHMRRNLLIAGALAAGPTPAVILLIAGAREVHACGVPAGVDCLSLPALWKEDRKSVV